MLINKIFGGCRGAKPAREVDRPACRPQKYLQRNHDAHAEQQRQRPGGQCPGHHLHPGALCGALGMTGTKFGWGTALRGVRAVHFNGVAIRSCITPISAAAGQKITTLEALGASA